MGNLNETSKRSLLALVVAILTAGVTLIIVNLTGFNSNAMLSPTAYVSKDTALTYEDSSNLLYESRDTETGNVAVYYKDGTWVTFSNDELYIVQQYLAPKNKSDILINEVSGLPDFNADDATYKAINNLTQTIYTLSPDTKYTDISTQINSNDFTVFIEWAGSKDSNTYYSYVMQYGDVSILYTYTDKACLFREYVSYVETQYPQDNAEGVEEGVTSEPADTGVEESEVTEATEADEEGVEGETYEHVDDDEPAETSESEVTTTISE